MGFPVWLVSRAALIAVVIIGAVQFTGAGIDETFEAIAANLA
jgi:Flp pilus assembly pilin Flp